MVQTFLVMETENVVLIIDNHISHYTRLVHHKMALHRYFLKVCIECSRAITALEWLCILVDPKMWHTKRPVSNVLF